MRTLAAFTCIIRKRMNTVIIPAVPMMLVAILSDRDKGSSQVNIRITTPPMASSIEMNDVIDLSIFLVPCFRFAVRLHLLRT